MNKWEENNKENWISKKYQIFKFNLVVKEEIPNLQIINYKKEKYNRKIKQSDWTEDKATKVTKLKRVNKWIQGKTNLSKNREEDQSHPLQVHHHHLHHQAQMIHKFNKDKIREIWIYKTREKLLFIINKEKISMINKNKKNASIKDKDTRSIIWYTKVREISLIDYKMW